MTKFINLKIKDEKVFVSKNMSNFGVIMRKFRVNSQKFPNITPKF
jgi:hypothetical protein